MKKARGNRRLNVFGFGAGIVVGAWYLARDGHEVPGIDRQPAAGMKTNFANGSEFSGSHAETWVNLVAQQG